MVSHPQIRTNPQNTQNRRPAKAQSTRPRPQKTRALPDPEHRLPRASSKGRRAFFPNSPQNPPSYGLSATHHKPISKSKQSGDPDSSGIPSGINNQSSIVNPPPPTITVEQTIQTDHITAKQTQIQKPHNQPNNTPQKNPTMKRILYEFLFNCMVSMALIHKLTISWQNRPTKK